MPFMATASLSLSRRGSPFAFIAKAWRHWRINRLRKCICRGCQTEPDVDPVAFLNQGQYRASVFMARLQLENEITTRFEHCKSIKRDRISSYSTRPPERVSYLVKNGCFDDD